MTFPRRPGAQVLRIGLLLLVAAAAPLHAAVLLDRGTLIGRPGATQVVEFQVATAGRLELRLTDLSLPAPLADLGAVVTRGSVTVVDLDEPGSVAFDATPGTYLVQVGGAPGSGSQVGTFGVLVQPVGGGSTVLEYSASVQSAVPVVPGSLESLQASFTIDAPGRYRVAAADLGFPEALRSLDVLVVRGGTPVAQLGGDVTEAEFDGVTGTYELLAVAQPGATLVAGLYGLRVVKLGSDGYAYDATHRVGRLDPAIAVEVPPGVAHSISVADLAFPVALGGAAALLARGASVLAARTTPGITEFTTTPGPAELYAFGTATATTNAGTASVQLLQGTLPYASIVALVQATSGGLELVVEKTQPVASGDYRATFTDFEFPLALVEAQFAAVQSGALLTKRTGPGNIDFAAQARPLDLIAAVRPAAGGGTGLFGIRLASSAGTVSLESTRAVGSTLDSIPLEIAAGGSYDVTLSDLDTPVRFQELAMAVTRGTTRVGSAFAGGRFSFNATPGTYLFNVLARTDPASGLGTYGLRVETTPPVPAVTLTVEPATVPAGGSATLSWTSTNASSCVAADGWTGSRALAGSQSVGPINAQTRYVLNCTGPGGSASANVTVAIRNQDPDGGGGRLDLGLILGLTALLLGRGCGLASCGKPAARVRTGRDAAVRTSR
jgi:hypothetical protein